MNFPNVEHLISIASIALVPGKAAVARLDKWLPSPLVIELREMLNRKNGFYAFESALHVLPIADQGNPRCDCIDIMAWNSAEAWRECYGNELADVVFFAEDIFGVQFGIRGQTVITFDPESSDMCVVASSVDDWAARLLADYAQLTGYPLAHAWQQLNGPLPPGRRLLPKVPFILGGKYDVDNLVSIDALRGMQYRGDMWRQIRDLPDGAQVRLKPLPLH